jgi:hypothetical protein
MAAGFGFTTPPNLTLHLFLYRHRSAMIGFQRQ